MTTIIYMSNMDGKDGEIMLSSEQPRGNNEKEWIPALVPFGGSALSMPHPDKAILGGKGLGLQEMSAIDGIDVPPGFTLTTPLCKVVCNDQKGKGSADLPASLWNKVQAAIRRVERDMGRKFGGNSNNNNNNTLDAAAQQPLLFSCRSGAQISMPGMMDTVLNIGLNDQTVEGLALATQNRRFAYDAYRRLLDMFGDVVLSIPHKAFEAKLQAAKDQAGVTNDVDLDAAQLEQLCVEYGKIYTDHNQVFPQDPRQQLKACIQAVFGSWNSPRAIKYREINGITGLLGTACNIQTMVFGNLGPTSGTGVAFSRDPGTGKAQMKGEYLVNAQGEDVVAGIRTPLPIQEMEKKFPVAYAQFLKNMHALERHFHDMQDVEFTIENERLWMLQCRSGKRTGVAAFQIASDLVEEGLLTREEALLKVDPDHVRQLLHPTFCPDALQSSAYKDNIVAVGLAGGPGAGVGRIVFDTKHAEEQAAKCEAVILVRENTSPEDVGGMWASRGILTSRGGVTSHAAVVARGWGKPCVCGCDQLEVDVEAGTILVKATGKVFKAGDVISLNGTTGEVVSGAIPTTTPSLAGSFGKILSWADDVQDSLKVLANADTGPDAKKARELGAKGIGLTRTEHMFFHPERLPIVRRWILHGDELEHLKEFQRSDFRAIFREMDGLPVTIRMLDPPLHEFLPHLSEVNEEFSKSLHYDDPQALMHDIEALHEENPMLGLRGCRLGICRPELTRVQTEAIISAAGDLIKENPDAKPFPRIMVPLVGSVAEFVDQAIAIKRTAERIKTECKIDIPYEIGTMIEVPRAAIVSDKIAAVTDPEDGEPLCKFFSYGTNDLTQMTLGISRDDAGEFIPKYKEVGIMEVDPFKTIDKEGAGWLVRLSATKGRSSNPNLSLSVCGEHGGDAKSVEFFDQAGLDYVSCSPFRVPVARLASGRAAVERKLAANGRFVNKKQRVTPNSPLDG